MYPESRLWPLGTKWLCEREGVHLQPAGKISQIRITKSCMAYSRLRGTVWEPRSSVMTARAARFPAGWFGAPLTSGQVVPGAAEVGGCWLGRTPAPASRGKETTLTCHGFCPAHRTRAGRLYSFQKKSENKNETKCKSEKGRRNTDMRRGERTKSRTTHSPTQTRGRGQSALTGPRAKHAQSLLSSNLKKEGYLGL